jgi:hypothetical protein
MKISSGFFGQVAVLLTVAVLLGVIVGASPPTIKGKVGKVEAVQTAEANAPPITVEATSAPTFDTDKLAAELAGVTISERDGGSEVAQVSRSGSQDSNAGGNTVSTGGASAVESTASGGTAG